MVYMYKQLVNKNKFYNYIYIFKYIYKYDWN